MAQLGARYLGVVEAAGSSPVTQTKKRQSFGCLFYCKKCRVQALFFMCAFDSRILKDGGYLVGGDLFPTSTIVKVKAI